MAGWAEIPFRFRREVEPGEFPMTFQLTPLPPLESPPSLPTLNPREIPDRKAQDVDMKIVSVQSAVRSSPRNGAARTTGNASSRKTRRKTSPSVVSTPLKCCELHRKSLPPSGRSAHSRAPTNIAEPATPRPEIFRARHGAGVIAVLASPIFLFRTEETVASES